jgi:hypothetical protein
LELDAAGLPDATSLFLETSRIPGQTEFLNAFLGHLIKRIAGNMYLTSIPAVMRREQST